VKLYKSNCKHEERYFVSRKLIMSCHMKRRAAELGGVSDLQYIELYLTQSDYVL